MVNGGFKHKSVVWPLNNFVAKPKVPNDIKEIEFDEVWRFVGSKKTSFGSLEQLIAVHGKLLPGSWVDEIL